MQSSQEGFQLWKALDPAERGSLLYRLALEIEKHAREFVELESLNTGKPTFQAEQEVKEAVKSLQYFAGFADKLTGKTYCNHQSNLFYTKREPLGVIALLPSANFPLLSAVQKLAAALCVGNTVIVKPSILTPLTVLRLGECLRATNFPRGVVNVLLGDNLTVGQRLVANPGVAKACIAASHAQNLKYLEENYKQIGKRLVLESENRTPIIVNADVDPEHAASLIQQVFLHNSGQNHIAVSQVYLHEFVSHKVIAHLKKGIKNFGVTFLQEGG